MERSSGHYVWCGAYVPSVPSYTGSSRLSPLPVVRWWIGSSTICVSHESSFLWSCLFFQMHKFWTQTSGSSRRRQLYSSCNFPKGHHVSCLLIMQFHERVCHQGCGITMNEINSNGIWIMRHSSEGSSIIYKCVNVGSTVNALKIKELLI